MEIDNQQIQPFTGTVQVGIVGDGEPAEVEVMGFPFGFMQRLERRVPSPPVPHGGFAREEDGSILRDSDGNAVPWYNSQDPDYKDRVAEVERRQRALMIRKALRGDESVTWDVNPNEYDLPEDWEDYAEDLADEMEDSLPPGADIKIVREANRLTRLDDKEIEKAQATFQGQEQQQDQQEQQEQQ